MIFDIQDRNRKMREYIEKVQTMINRSELEGFVIMLRGTDGSHRHLIFPGRVIDFEWIGALDSTKFEILKQVRNQYGTELYD